MIYQEGDKVAWAEPGTKKTREATVVGKVEGNKFPKAYFLNTVMDNGMQRCVTALPDEIQKIKKEDKQ